MTELTQAEKEKVWQEWLADRPANVRSVAERFPPWQLVRVKPTGQHAQIVSYSEPEDGGPTTLTVLIVGHDDEFLAAMAQAIPLEVFGLKPDDLEPITTIAAQATPDPKENA